MIDPTSHRVIRILAVLAHIGAIYFAIQTDVGGEEQGGTLTGPLIRANAIGCLCFLGSIILVLLNSGFARPLSIGGALGIAAWQSWRLFPGIWCAAGNCHAEPQLFVFDATSMLAVTFAIGAVILTFRAVKK